jgi:hypothetical protein
VFEPLIIALPRHPANELPLLDDSRTTIIAIPITEFSSHPRCDGISLRDMQGLAEASP